MFLTYNIAQASNQLHGLILEKGLDWDWTHHQLPGYVNAMDFDQMLLWLKNYKIAKKCPLQYSSSQT